MSVPKKSIANFLNFPATKEFLENILKDQSKEFTANLIAMCDNDENLAACDPKDLMMCALNATSLNLPLQKNLGYAYIIPYKGVPSFQIGYKGLIQLAIKTGAYEFLKPCVIRQGEISRNKITGEITFYGEKPDNKIVGFLAYMKLKSGFQASVYMSVDDIEAHAKKYSSMYKADLKYNNRRSKWSDPDERPKMAQKTVLKKLLGTYGVMTTELANAMNSDNENEVAEKIEDAEAEVIQQGEPEPQQPQAETAKTIQL